MPPESELWKSLSPEHFPDRLRDYVTVHAEVKTINGFLDISRNDIEHLNSNNNTNSNNRNNSTRVIGLWSRYGLKRLVKRAMQMYHMYPVLA